MTYGIMCMLAAVLSSVGTWLLCKYLLSRLGQRELGIKEMPATVRDVPGEGEYVPRCGGLLACAAVLAAAVVSLLMYAFFAGRGGSGAPRLSRLQSMYIWSGIVMAPLFGAAGFLEDYALVFRRMCRGLAGWQRLLIQAAVALAYLAALWLSGDGGEGRTTLPFAGEVSMGFWFYPLSLLLILAVVRGAELAQEADGVMPAVSFFSLIPIIASAGFLMQGNSGIADAGIIAVAGAGGCLAFLPVNLEPAQTRTGTAGGAFMGALLCAAAFASRMPVLLLLAGSAYIIESLTALFAWVSGKLFGREIGAPLHRLIGRTGRNDMQITVIMAAITALLGAVGTALAIFG